MMAEYIEREALLQRLKFKRDTTVNLDGRKRYGLDSAISQVRKAQKADVAEVRHGEWVYHECVSSYDGAISGYSCSLCSSFVDEEIFESDDFHDEFCGHCGADMRGVEDGR